MSDMGRAINQAMRSLDRERAWLETTPQVVCDLRATRPGKWATERRYRLMWLGYIDVSKRGEVFDSLAGCIGVKPNDYRWPDDVTLCDIQAIDAEIAELRRKRGLILAERFETWPLLTKHEIERCQETKPR